MQTFFLFLIALYVAFYCFSYAWMYFKSGNKLAGITLLVMVGIALGSPYIFFLDL